MAIWLGWTLLLVVVVVGASKASAMDVWKIPSQSRHEHFRFVIYSWHGRYGDT